MENITIVALITVFILFMFVYNKTNVMKERAYYKEEFEYLKTPSYRSYLDLVQINLKSPPYYRFNNEPLSIPVFYNYLLPNIPAIDMSKCPTNNILQYWYTPQ
jgi:hypothetical protein